MQIISALNRTLVSLAAKAKERKEGRKMSLIINQGKQDTSGY